MKIYKNSLVELYEKSTSGFFRLTKVFLKYTAIQLQ